MSLVVTTPPAGPALELEALKADLGVTTNTEDQRLVGLIERATSFLEKHIDATLITTAYLWCVQGFGSTRSDIDDFWFEPSPAGYACDPVMRVPRAPLIAVQTVKYYDDAGTLQTITSSNYQVDARSRPGRIAPVSTYTWPTPGRRLDPVEIAFTAGYGTSASDVPADLRGAISMLVAHWNENREAMSMAGLNTVPLGFDEMVQPYMNWSR